MFGFLSQGVIGDILAPVKSPGQQLHAAIEDNLVDKAIRLIKEERVDFNFRDMLRDNAVPLHTAAKAGNQVMVDLLLDMGASLQVKDGTGNTPLHYAAKAGRVDLVKYLVGSKRADVACRNSHRHTPYDVATNHIIRQYLLPLQLRAEPEPEPSGLSAVHNPDIVRDYSNLPPPPTSFPAQAFAPPTHYAPIKHSGWTDPSVTRPIAADGFHSSAGDPKLAAKYGHTKSEINIAPPPAIGARPLTEGPPQPIPQFSAFAHGRPVARYVAYDASTEGAAVHQQAVPSWQGQQASGAGRAGSPYTNSPTQMGAPVTMGVPPVAPAVPQYQAALSPPLPQQQQYAPPPPPLPQQRPHSVSPTQQFNVAYGGQPQQQPAQFPPTQAVPPPPQQQQRVFSPQPPQAFAPPQQQQPPPPGIRLPSAPSSGGVPTLPSPNRISVFQPAWSDNGEDAVPLT